jgi:hypothetical protein
VSFDFFESAETLRELWRDHGEEVVEEHVAEHPGTRPDKWWRYDAPEPRHRLGGTGTPCHERLAHVLRLSRGVPVDWITPDAIEPYERMGSPDLKVPPIDPGDPPLFESEATYLDRLNLFLPGAAPTESNRIQA